MQEKIFLHKISLIATILTAGEYALVKNSDPLFRFRLYYYNIAAWNRANGIMAENTHSNGVEKIPGI